VGLSSNGQGAKYKFAQSAPSLRKDRAASFLLRNERCLTEAKPAGKEILKKGNRGKVE